MSWRMYLTILDKEMTDTHRSKGPESYLRNRDEEDEDDEDEEYNTEFFSFVKNDFGRKDEYCIGFLPISPEIGVPFYLKAETQELFEYYRPRIISKEECLSIIEEMRLFIVDYYKDVLNDPNPDRLRRVLENTLDTWEAQYIKPYNIRDNDKSIVNVFDAEYQIFDMIRLYKTVDWDKDYVIFWGW